MARYWWQCISCGAYSGCTAARSARTLNLASLRYAWIIATVIAWPVSAADFRSVDFGSSCAPVRELEEAQGSVQIPWKKVEDGELIAFKGRAFERDVSIVYHCIGGQLVAGSHFFLFEGFSGVVSSYGEVHEKLVGLHGRPFLDTSPRYHPDDLNHDQRAALSDPVRYMTIWITPRVRISLTLMPRVGSSEDEWQVFVMASANRMQREI